MTVSLRFLTSLLMLTHCCAVLGQPGAMLHTESKKAIKLYRKAMELSRASMVSDGDRAESKASVEADLLKALSIDPEFAEAERIIAALRFDEGRFEESRDHYAHFLALHGADFIRDHLRWAESARHALDPASMKEAMSVMWAIPGVQDGPDVSAISRMNKDAEFMAMALMNPVPDAGDVLPAPVSTGHDEYFPGVWLAGEALMFTRKTPAVGSRHGQEDLYVAMLEGGRWTEPKPMIGLNTPENEGAAALSGDGRLICFTMCREADRPGQGSHKGSCDLYIAERMGDRWGRPVNLGAVNSGGWESQPCLSPDGQQLYFVRGSGRPTERKFDIFTARRNSQGQWGQAVRLGGAMNTSGKEMRPFIHPDGQHFYFASDGLPGMGGMDMYVCTLSEEGKWGEPVNLGWPLNTPDDEAGLVVASDGRTAYFSREVDGQLDLHSWILPDPVAADATAAMEGRITSQDGTPLATGRISLVDRTTGAPFAEALATSEGRYHVPVPLDRPFVMIAEADGHMLVSERVEAGSVEGRMQRDFLLDPLVVGAEVVLRNVFFETGSAVLDGESQAELTRVGRWIASHPEVQVEVEGHTDDVGSAASNMTLSEQRAAAVVDALVAAGALPGQLQSRGYGQTRPAVQGTDEASRRKNRRTALRITEME